jgi:hypothetical protein
LDKNNINVAFLVTMPLGIMVLPPTLGLIRAAEKILDSNKQSCNPVHPTEARLFLSDGKAAVFRQYPFTIIQYGALKQYFLPSLKAWVSTPKGDFP